MVLSPKSYKQWKSIDNTFQGRILGRLEFEPRQAGSIVQVVKKSAILSFTISKSISKHCGQAEIYMLLSYLLTTHWIFPKSTAGRDNTTSMKWL